MLPADADQLYVSSRPCPQRANEVGAEQVARFLAGDHRYAQRARHVSAPGRPTMNRPSLSASAIVFA